jgi:hypothetical protein
MGSRYLLELPDVCAAAGLAVHLEAGWETRARGSGGYASGAPNHVMVHHTASSTSPANDVAYMCHGSDNAPIANLYLARDGAVTVMAAGATNTNGTGDDPCEHLAPDTMNANAIGIEAANAGTGEAWPAVQQDAYVALVAALCTAYAIPTGQIHAHVEYAPGRKIDPAGPARWPPVNPSGSWNMDPFRGDVWLATFPPPGPEPEPEPRRLRVYQLLVDDDGAYWAHDSIHVRWLPTEWSRAHYANLLTLSGLDPAAMAVSRDAIDIGEFGPVVGRIP